MNLKLVRNYQKYGQQIIDMLEEWIAYNDTHKTNHSPMAIFRNDYHDFGYYSAHLKQKEPAEGLVQDSTFFCLDEDINQIVGTVIQRYWISI